MSTAPTKSRDMKLGEALATDATRANRMGYALAPKYLDVVLGGALRRDVHRGTPLGCDPLA